MITVLKAGPQLEHERIRELIEEWSKMYMEGEPVAAFVMVVVHANGDIGYTAEFGDRYFSLQGALGEAALGIRTRWKESE